MEDCGFQSQLLSVMEVLAKAAVAEITRRVDDSCAVLRLEVSQSRRDIELLKRKSEVMEAELRRSRMRARRKAFYPPAAERFSPLVRVVLNRGRQSTCWDAGAQTQPQQCADVERANEAGHILIKEECAEEDLWKNESEDKLICEAEQMPHLEASQPAQTDIFVEHYHRAENAAEPGSLVFPTDGYDRFPEQQQQQQQPHRHQTAAELVVKHERDGEPEEKAAPLDSAHRFVTEEGDGQLWSSNQCRDAAEPSFPYSEPPPSVAPPQSGLHLEDTVPRIHSIGKSHSVVVSSARVKRRARMFGCKRPQPDEGHGALSQINTMGRCSVPPPSQLHQYPESPQGRNPNQDLTPPPNLAAGVSSFCGHSRSGLGLARRTRTPWRSGIGEKRFSCTYCDKSFMRFSQLKEHLRSHTGEKPFSCLQCGRSFTKQCNLIRHAVVHSGEKPYACSLCGKCFTQRSSLKSHQKTAH
ncbi:zinc finger and SCAN domain-containing protein 2 [Sander lucioperca]|uniref:zinc finger and SCAN domain-containing protein 2 n=1 Tax=Sander lucioperca TaxID=283035 RepID=UPI001653D15D|nr:zinc finger and SCAN domain-containing protein 2 [Sander lucioperca]